MTNPTADPVADARDRLRGMALSLATGAGPLVEPREFDAAIDAYGGAVRAAAAPATPPADPAGLRQRIAETLTAKAYECDGKCGLSERECYDAHPITFSAMCNGTTHIDAPVTAIADAVLAVLPAPADRAAVLREAADWYAQQGKVVLAASQVAADLRRRADAEPRRMADETAATETPTEEPICSDEPPRDGTWGDCWCTLPPGHDGEHRCQPCTDRHGAPGWTDPAAAQPAGGEQ